MMRITIRAGILTLLLLAGLDTAPRAGSPRDRVQRALNELTEAAAVPGASAAVVMPDGEAIAVAAGWADRERQVPMTPETLLLQGSVGKTYVAAVALQLIEEGRLGLDDAIGKHLGEEPWFDRLPNAPQITVRMLMNHTSGLVRYEFQERFIKDLVSNPEKRWRPEELIEYILDTEPPFRAGEGWEYSDTNYIVLGIIIEKVSGAEYFEELRRRILEPLGLQATHPVSGPELEGLAQGYAGARNPFGGKDQMLDEHGRMIINPQFEWTGGGIASTPGDLAKWAKLLYEGKAFAPELMPQMLDGVVAPMLGREARYGLGVIIRQTAIGPSYGHSGFFPGYMCEVMYWPEQGIAIAVQVNTSETRLIRPPLAGWCVKLAEALGRPANHPIDRR